MAGAEGRRSRSGAVLMPPGSPDHEGVAGFFLEHHRLLRRYLIAQGCAEGDSDDIVQDAFLIVRRRWATIAYYDNPKAYLYKVAIRLWYRHSARQLRANDVCDPELQLRAVADPADRFAEVDLADTLTRWFRRLPRQQRNVAGLRLIVGLSEVETAEILNVSLGTVKSQLNAARRAFKQLRDDDQAEGDAR